jgi:ferritin-like metal-binding protein YciE
MPGDRRHHQGSRRGRRRSRGQIGAGCGSDQSGQAAEHCEIARYGSLIAWAKLLGRNGCASVLQKTLDEEKATEKKLTALAESKINLRAAS